MDFIYNKCTLEIREDGVILADSQQDENGKIVPVPGTEKLYPCTGVIVAVSQGAESNIVTTTRDIDTSKSGLLTVDADPPRGFRRGGRRQRSTHRGGSRRSRGPGGTEPVKRKRRALKYFRSSICYFRPSDL